MLLQAAMFVLTSGRGLWRLRQWQTPPLFQKGPGRKEHSQGRRTSGNGVGREALRHSQEWEAGPSPREEAPHQEPSGSSIWEVSSLTGTGDEATGRREVTEQRERERDTFSLSLPWPLDLQPGLPLARHNRLHSGPFYLCGMSGIGKSIESRKVDARGWG